jgi:hypothetical protein
LEIAAARQATAAAPAHIAALDVSLPSEHAQRRPVRPSHQMAAVVVPTATLVPARPLEIAAVRPATAAAAARTAVADASLPSVPARSSRRTALLAVRIVMSARVRRSAIAAALLDTAATVVRLRLELAISPRTEHVAVPTVMSAQALDSAIVTALPGTAAVPAPTVGQAVRVRMAPLMYLQMGLVVVLQATLALDLRLVTAVAQAATVEAALPIVEPAVKLLMARVVDEGVSLKLMLALESVLSLILILSFSFSFSHSHSHSLILILILSFSFSPFNILLITARLYDIPYISSPRTTGLGCRKGY